MKIVKKVFFAALAASALAVLLLMSCSEESVDREANIALHQEYFKNNVALVDARIRSINSSKYVKEVVLVDFAKKQSAPKIITFNGVQVADNGLDHDKVAGDGIYTTLETFVYTKSTSYSPNEKVHSILDHPIADPEFEHFQSLQELAVNFKGNGNNNSKTELVELSCPVAFGTNGCLATDWGWCSDCCFAVDWDNCNLSLSIP